MSSSRLYQRFSELLRRSNSRGADLVATFVAAALYFNIPWDYSILDPRQIDWMLNVPFDLGIYLLGINYFRFSDWAFPITYFDSLLYPVGGTITTADGLPLFAIPFKLLDPFLPERPLQYFGIWLLVCFWLQAFLATRILRALAVPPVIRWCGTLVVLASLPLAFATMTASLWGHWLVLGTFRLALYPKLPVGKMSLLLAVAPWVHPYLFLMVVPLCGAVFLRHWRAPKWELARGALVVASATLASCWLVGYFAMAQTKSHLGTFMIDVFALFNPIGTSSLLPDLPIVKEHYEGFAYLGLGGLLLLGFLLLKPAVPAWRRSKTHVTPVLIVCVLLALYAIGTRPLVLGELHPKIPYLHDWIMPILSRTRATGRFVWPLYYYILLWGFASLHKQIAPRRVAAGLALAVLLVQAIDAGPWLVRQGHRAELTQPAPIGKLTDAERAQVTPQTRILAFVPPILRVDCRRKKSWTGDYWGWALLGAQRRLKTTSDFKIFARVSKEDHQAACRETSALWRNRNRRPDVLLIGPRSE